jgi:predicted transcriptional regulator
MRMLVSKGHVSNVSRGKYRITEEGESLLGGDTPDVQPATKQMSLFTE